LLGIEVSLFIAVAFMRFYIPLMTITFNLSVRQLYKNAAIFAIKGLGRNILVGCILSIYYILLGGAFFTAVRENSDVSWGFFSFLLLIYILFFRAFRSFLIQFAAFPLIKKYMLDPYYEKNPDKDIQLQKNLGLCYGTEEPEEERDKNEVIFEDQGRRKPDGEEGQEAFRLPKQYNNREINRGPKDNQSKNKQKNHGWDDDGII
jgi:hypothetical protein